MLANKLIQKVSGGNEIAHDDDTLSPEKENRQVLINVDEVSAPESKPIDYGGGHKIKISSLLKKSTEK